MSRNAKSSALPSPPNPPRSTLLLLMVKTLMSYRKPKCSASPCLVTSSGTTTLTKSWRNLINACNVCPSWNVLVWNLQNWSSSTGLAFVQLQVRMPSVSRLFTSLSVQGHRKYSTARHEDFFSISFLQGGLGRGWFNLPVRSSSISDWQIVHQSNNGQGEQTSSSLTRAKNLSLQS